MAHLTERQDFVRRIVAASKLPESKSRALAGKLYAMRYDSKQLAIDGCNRELTEAEKLLDNKMDAEVKAIGERLGLKAYRQDDARGNTIRVVVGQELADNMDGETVGCG